MPMADFDEGGKDAAPSNDFELESPDDVIGDGGEKPRRPRGGRRPRRRD